MCLFIHVQAYDACLQATPDIDLEKKKNLGGNRTHDHHNSDVTALPVELPSPWEQGGGKFTHGPW